MKRLLIIIALPLLLAACAQSTVSPGNPSGIDPFKYDTIASLPTLGDMGKAMSASPDILSAIKGDQPVTVLLLPDKTLNDLMKAKNTNASAFFATSAGQTFLKNHVVTRSIYGAGTYTSLGGLTWKVTPDTVEPYGPFVVNGQDSEGCYQTSTQPPKSSNTHLDAICLMKGDITAAQ